ncbi:hypothetical protein V6N11_050062 [Hibiscus sabdariffa]|uniref:C2 domain-containing protein n=1 Tax=Hibiscus sabdariffa TaxID=183260 RepID=A0ABR2T8R3_9ROSI
MPTSTPCFLPRPRLLFPSFKIEYLCLAASAAALCAFIAPSAAGSGIPEVKTYLNGVDAYSILAPSTLFVKSDPMVVVYIQERDGAFTEVFRTEVVLNSLNPKWITKYTVTYQFEIVQTLLFRVFDVDTQFHNVAVKMLKLEEQQYLGEASCALSEIVSKANRSLTLDLVQREEYVPSTYSQHRGKLTVHAEECFSSKTTTEMTLKCLNLESKDLFSKSVCIADFIFS